MVTRGIEAHRSDADVRKKRDRDHRQAAHTEKADPKAGLPKLNRAKSTDITASETVESHAFRPNSRSKAYAFHPWILPHSLPQGRAGAAPLPPPL